MSRNGSGEGPSYVNESISPMGSTRNEWEGLDDINMIMEGRDECESVEGECSDMETEGFNMEIEGCFEENSFGFEYGENVNEQIVCNLDDILDLDLKNLSPYEFRNVQFSSLEVAYLFYYWFARLNGFSARRSRVLKNKKGEIIQQSFVCYRQGFREDRGLSRDKRKRYIQAETRCGCEAKFTVHVDQYSGLWYITYFLDDHNHVILKDEHCRLLPSHRTLTDSDVMHLNNMRDVGISTPHIYRSLANQVGGYDKVGFRKKDLYNQSGRQRKMKNVDAKGALQYLSGLVEKDPLMFIRHTVDDDNSLQHLFWCDGIMRMDYKIFGDVLAFDATYGKNKYECPLVIFSGVNHHNHTVVFAAAFVSNEKEETYVWLLDQFVEAMNGKAPRSVITDGDVAMKNSIRKVFPNAHHRLCAWHLLRNATSNIGNRSFTGEFRKCMLGDYEVGEFKKKWAEIIQKFNLEHHPWVLELYEKRRMWCTAYMRGCFFGGFRTTSRCEALHSQVAKFVYSRYNLTELLQHFNSCLNLMRYREVEADFQSNHGLPVLTTHFRGLERCASNVFTKEIFDLFRSELDKCGTVRVVGYKESFQYVIYTVAKYDKSNRVWQVSYKQSSNEFKCSCRRMETFGLPCDHILRILIHLNIHELPECLLLKRWTKTAKEEIQIESSSNNFWGSEKDGRFLSLMEHFKQISVLASESFDNYDDQRQKAIHERNQLLAKKASEGGGSGNVTRQTTPVSVSDPKRVQSKGGRSHIKPNSATERQGSIIRKCGICREAGHNKRNCPTNAIEGVNQNTMEDCVSSEDEVNYNSLQFDDNQDLFDDQSTADVASQSFGGSLSNILR